MTAGAAAESPSRQRPSLIVLGVLVALIFIGFAALRSGRDLAAQKRRVDELERRIDHTEERVERLEERIRSLKEDPVAIERAARRELGFIEPGETVFVFPEETGESDDDSGEF